MVCFDATVLIDLFDTRPKNVNRDRLDLLVTGFDQTRTKIALPAPAFTEFLVGAGRARGALASKIQTSSRFVVKPFSTKAAMECAIMLADVLNAKDQKQITKAKIKYDWMIVAIAKSENAQFVYSSDADIERACKRVGLPFIKVDSLPLPPVNPQKDWINSASEVDE